MGTGAKQSIKEYVIIRTKLLLRDINESNLNSCSTTEISSHLHLSRTLTSQYLNEMVKEGILEKISSRPVFYVHRESIEQHCKTGEGQLDSMNGQEFLLFLRGGRGVSIFRQMIGYDTSLAYCLEQCKSAVRYPKWGLPVLLSGEPGTGKRFLAKLLFQYAIEENIIKKESVFSMLECGETEKTSEAGIKELFGSYTVKSGKKILTPGLLEQVKGGILFLSNVDMLGVKCQEKLAEFLESRAYSISNRKSEQYISHARMIFSVAPEQKHKISKSLLAQIPVLCEIPTLTERGLEDKEKLIMKFFRDEEIAFKKDIRISREVFQRLMEYRFAENISQLKNCIKVACANAFFSQEDEDKISVLLYHLPEILFVKSGREGFRKDEEFIEVNKYREHKRIDKVILYYEQVMLEFGRWKEKELTFWEFVKQSTIHMNRYYDYIIYERRFDNRKVKAMELAIRDILASEGEKNDILLPSQCAYVLARSIYMLIGVDFEMEEWEKNNRERIQECLFVLKEEMPVEMRIAAELREAMEESFRIKLNEMSVVFLLLNTHFFNRKIHRDKMRAMILTIGYRTASSIADTANRLLGKHIFESVDIPKVTPKQQILEAIDDRLKKEYFCKSLLLFTDLERGTEIAEELALRFQLEVGLVNQISTSIVVNAGKKLLEQKDIKEILGFVCENNRLEVQSYDKGKRQPAILFASELGEVVNQRIIKMFEDSILGRKDFRFLSYDGTQMTEAGWDEMKRFYDILFILGTQNPGLKEIPFIPLEDIISFQNLDTMNYILSNYLTEEETEVFRENLIKNFTLQNVVSQLTILNVNILMEYLDRALKIFQAEMDTHLSVAVSIGISIHLACMVERLVTKTEIEETERSEVFQIQHPEFIRCMKNAFRELTSHYHIQIPISEMVYVFDYIQNENTEEDF